MFSANLQSDEIEFNTFIDFLESGRLVCILTTSELILCSRFMYGSIWQIIVVAEPRKWNERREKQGKSR
jgi:hypothetical protein